MLTVEEINQKLKEANAYGDLLKAIDRCSKDMVVADMSFEFIEEFRENEWYTYVFELGGRKFMAVCGYESWNDWGLDTYDLKDLREVKQVERTIKEWVYV